jgi:DNA-binding beta-propeller fold protein YncE
VGGMDTQLLKFARDGKFLMEVGNTVAAPAPGAARPGDTTYAGVSGAPRPQAANRPVGRGGGPQLPPASGSTDAFGGASSMSFDASTNEAFVADGWRNRRVAVVDMATGAIKRFWGASGNKPDDAVRTTQQFGTPVSCAELARDGLLYVCDRANNRLQVFRKDGSFVKEKVIAPNTKGEGSVWDVAFSRDPQQRYLYVADGLNMKVHILDRQSLNVLTSFGDGGRQPGQFYALHSIATDSRGNIYTTETYEGKRVQKFNFKGVGAVTAPARTTWPRSGGSQ